MTDSGGDRTEAASARRLQRAREEGDVPVSREVTALAGLAGGASVVAVQLAAAGHAPLLWFAAMLQRRGVEGTDALAQAAGALLLAVVPAAAGATLAVLAVGAMQTGFLFRVAALQADLSRVSPLRGLKRMASPETLVAAATALAKLGMLSFGLWWALHRMLPGLAGAVRWPASVLQARLLAEAGRLLLLLAGAQLVLAGADLVWVRLRHARKLRMSRQEQSDEYREAEGNPLVRQRLRQLARARSRRRMIAAVRTASVVVTNPEHYAVALAYERGSRAAPRVVAKGVDDVAARIREEARRYHIPTVANPPLARALFRIELDAEIPVEHFKAVAEIVAYVWRLRTRRTL